MWRYFVFAEQHFFVNELPGLDERSALLPYITSTRDNCLGAQCPKFRACHVHLARREAMAADVVVVNHHLFFADLAVRESGMAELLPSVQTVIFDEAHQLNETGLQFLGRTLGTGQVLDVARDMLATGLQLARGMADWQALAAAVERAARELRMVVGRVPPGSRLRWATQAPDGVDALAWSKSLDDLHASQVTWHEQQASSFEDYMRTQRDQHFTADRGWPVRS